MRFGIEMNTDHTLEEVGKQFDVTRERIRQIEAKALRKLRHPSRSEKLRSFLEARADAKLPRVDPPSETPRRPRAFCLVGGAARVRADRGPDPELLRI